MDSPLPTLTEDKNLFLGNFSLSLFSTHCVVAEGSEVTREVVSPWPRTDQVTFVLGFSAFLLSCMPKQGRPNGNSESVLSSRHIPRSRRSRVDFGLESEAMGGDLRAFFWTITYSVLEVCFHIRLPGELESSGVL